MQIITNKDKEFAEILDAMKHAVKVGSYTTEEKEYQVAASSQFMFVAPVEAEPEKIAIKPTRSQAEAVSVGIRLLWKEHERGNFVHFEPGFERSH